MKSLSDFLNKPSQQSNGSISPSNNSSSSRSLGTLKREGIQSVSTRVVPGSEFGRPVPRYKSTDNEIINEKRHSKGTVKSSDMPNSQVKLFLDRENWISLGEGWHQVTPVGTGSTARAGLHSVVESISTLPFACLYIPRSQAAYQASLGVNPEFDLEVHVKLMPPQVKHTGLQKSKTNSLQFQIVFAFKSSNDYCFVQCDSLNQCWNLVHYNDFQGYSLLGQVADGGIKPNVFYHVLIQIRGNSVSIDINGNPLFTGVKMHTTVGLGGLMGLLALNSKFAVKGWKLKGLGNSNLQRSVISASEESPNQSSNSPKETGDTIFNISRRSVDDSVASKAMSLSQVLERKGINNMNNVIESNEGFVTKQYPTPSSSSSSVQIPKEIPNTYGLSKQILDQLLQTNERAILDCILRDVIQHDIGVKFEDIASLQEAKRLLHETIVLPIIMPEFFTGIREPWKGVLLFGPPGTGKTMLAKAVCSLQNHTFFNSSASTLISKFRGDSEKIVKCLFQAARLCAPSIIFIDEIDALMSARGGDNEHEASRRLKTELFTQIDGIASMSKSSNPSQSVIILAATNCPWDLDPAMRRRLEKRIYIPLPDFEARRELIKLLLKNIPVSDDVNIEELISLSEGFSGSDLQIACRDASMMPMRRLLNVLDPQTMADMKKSGQLLVPKVTRTDFFSAFQNTRPSVSHDSLLRYSSWEQEFSNR